MNYEFGGKISRILHEFSNGEMIVYQHPSNERYAIIEMNGKHYAKKQKTTYFSM